MKRLKEFRGIFIVTILCITVILCLQLLGPSKLDEDEIAEYIQSNNLDVDWIQDTLEDYTVLYLSDNRTVIILYKNVMGKLFEGKDSDFGETGRLNEVDVEFWSTDPLSVFVDGHVGVSIKEAALQDEALYVECYTSNNYKYTEYINGNKNLMIQLKRRFFWEKPRIEYIEVYDSDGNVISGFYN